MASLVTSSGTFETSVPSSPDSSAGDGTDTASLYAIYAEFLRSVYATAHTYATHAGDEDVECYDVVRAMRRELIDPENGVLAHLKPLFRSPSNASPEQAARLNEHVQGASMMLQYNVDESVVEEAMFACLLSGCSLSEAIDELQQECAEREREKQERHALIAADPTAQQIWQNAMARISQGRGAQVFGVDQCDDDYEDNDNNNNNNNNNSVAENEHNDICRDGEGDEEYAMRRDGRCMCDSCTAVAHTRVVWSEWAPSDQIEQQMCDLSVRLTDKLFEGAIDIVEDENNEESEYEEDEYTDDDGDDDPFNVGH